MVGNHLYQIYVSKGLLTIRDDSLIHLLRREGTTRLVLGDMVHTLKLTEGETNHIKQQWNKLRVKGKFSKVYE